MANTPLDVDEVAPNLDFLREPIVLTKRELEVTKEAAMGKRNRDIASLLGISMHTVRHHITNIRRKLGIRRRTELAAYAMRTGLI